MRATCVVILTGFGLVSAQLGYSQIPAQSAAPAAPLALVREGKPAAAIIFPDRACPSVRAAADELQHHVWKATGATLPVVNEQEAGVKGPAIYLGPCRKTQEAGITADGLKINGWRIRSQGENLFILGNDNDDDPFRFPKYSTYARTGTLFGVYDLLEREMGVRWVWPGELGEVVPRRTTLLLPPQDLTGAPRFPQKRWGNPIMAVWDKGWRNPDAGRTFCLNENVWQRRHRFAQEEPIVGAHGFVQYGLGWDKVGKAHPEWFQQMPDGTRGPDARQQNRPTAAGSIGMCVSNEKLRAQLVEHWSQTGQRAINAGENDVNGRCTCPACLAMDLRDETPAARLEQARKAFAENAECSRWKGWPLVLGSLSDRYAQFWLLVQKDIRQVRPDAIVAGCAYANWVQPPVHTKLNEGICVHIVAPFYFPFTDKRREDFRKIWEGWQATGCQLINRPNYTLSGNNFPIFYARKLGEDLAWMTAHGMAGAMPDTLIGQWAAQGPNHYVVARMIEHPELPVETVLQEYYGAFGPAAAAVEAYFRHWESISDAVTEDVIERNEEGRLDYVNSYGTFYRAADVIFTPEVMATGRTLLARAAEAAAGDETARARVDFLQLGLRHTELTLAVEAARREGEKRGDRARFVRALRELDDFRAQHESQGIANMYILWYAETKGNKTGAWDRELK